MSKFAKDSTTSSIVCSIEQRKLVAAPIADTFVEVLDILIRLRHFDLEKQTLIHQKMLHHLQKQQHCSLLLTRLLAKVGLNFFAPRTTCSHKYFTVHTCKSKACHVNKFFVAINQFIALVF